MQDDPLKAARVLATQARRWSRRRLGAWLVAAAGFALAAWLLTRHPLLSMAAAIPPLLAGGWLHWRRPITARLVARHLDRTVPSLEESTALLLDEAAQDDVLRRLQRRRAARAFAALDGLPPLPIPAARRAVMASTLVLVVAALLSLMVRRAPATPAGAEPTAADAPAPTPLALERVTLAWTPPAYLGRPAARAPGLDATVEEGSEVTWTIEAAGAAGARIIDLLGDTIRAVAIDGTWRATTQAQRPVVWRAEALDAAGTVVRGTEHLLRVLPDRAPVIAILAPPGRTELEWDEPHRVVVRAVVSDDHAIGATALLATVAAGRGEGVRFRERRLPLQVETRRGAGEWVVSALVDLDVLEVAPGDEVYLAVEARDRRLPEPQVSRSETVFLALRDTLDAVGSDFGGIAIDLEPEFFRSQRQIILDTEALLAEVRAGRVRDPLPRSAEIGYDQYLLRLRYGEIAGQEDEMTGAEADAPITEEDLLHAHDTEENATLLAASVKATLQRALAAMWEAEKQLRTGHPTEALPFEYRALVALEEIRQAQRAYVKRIGFDPPAIDVARTRLTKEARELAPLTRRGGDTPRAADEIRDALAALDAPDIATRDATLERAARRLAGEALVGLESRHLETLAAMRRLLDGDPDGALREVVRRGLHAALPAPGRPIVRTDPP